MPETGGRVKCSRACMFSTSESTTEPMASVSGIEQSVAELYWKSNYPNSLPAYGYDEVGWFGSKAFKAIGKVAKGVVKIAVAPIKHTVNAASDIAHGKNVFKSVAKMVTADLKTLGSVAPYVQTVVSFVPGVGSVASSALGAVSAGLQGKSLAEIAKAAASGAVPGGPLMVAAVATAVNMVSAGVQGQNIAKAAATELASAAAGLVPNPQLAQVLRDATKAGINGQNVLKGAKASVVRQALNAIPDPNARAAAEAVLSGKSPVEAVKAAGAQFLTKVAAKGGPATGSLVQAVQVGAAKMKSSNVIPIRQVQAMGPSLSPQLRALRPSLPFNKPVQRSLVSARKIAPGVVHRPLSQLARAFVVQRAGAVRRDVSGLTPDGKWLVQTGDTGEKIALAVVGNKSRWTELKAANPTLMKARAAAAKKYGFPIYKGDVINLPASWVKAAVVPTPVVTPIQIPPAVVPTGAPMGQPVPQVVITSLPTVLAPSGDNAAQLQARALLAAWGKSDGITSAGSTDYGGLLELGATNWSARDVLQAASFEVWWNRTYRPSAPILPPSGAWTQALNDSLHDWSERKATQILPGAVLPTVIVKPSEPAPQAQPPVSPGTDIVPASGGTPVIQLPGLIITGNPPANQAPPPSSQAQAEPAAGGFGEWWTNNKGAAIPGLLGLGVTVASKYI